MNMSPNGCSLAAIARMGGYVRKLATVVGLGSLAVGWHAGAALGTSETPGVLLVEFGRSAVPNADTTLGLSGITSPTLRAILSANGFLGARRIFPTFAESETIATNGFGESVGLANLARWYRVEVDTTSDLDVLSQGLRAISGVAKAGKSTRGTLNLQPNDPYFGSQWYLNNTSNASADIDATGAWDISVGRDDVAVPLIDGGVFYQHADLDPGDRTRMRVADGWGDAQEDGNPGTSFYHHGTHVAGGVSPFFGPATMTGSPA